MANYTTRLKKILRQNGCEFRRQARGDHEQWYSPINGALIIVDNKIVSRHMANEVLKQAGLPKQF